MKQPSIYIATPDAQRYLQLLQESLGSDADIATATTMTEAEERYGGQPVLLGQPDFAAAVLRHSPPVQWVQSTWAGVTPLIDLPFRAYRLSGVKQVFGLQMAEYVIGYILAHELRISERKANQRQNHWDHSPSGRLQGKTLGVMGAGSIGREIARIAAVFQVRLLGYNSRGNDTEPFARVYSGNSLTTFLRECDYVVAVLPDVPATTNLIDAAALDAMKRSAVLINVGRGNLIDEPALIEALQTGQLAGAVLDVFRQEPLPDSSPLWTAPNLTITGHIAAVSHPEDIAAIFIDNYRRFAANKALLHLIDFDKGY